MVFQKVTFERLFPVVRHRMGTFFGFEFDNKRYFDIAVPGSGKKKIEQGMTVVALLEKPNGWEMKGLMGWVDCSDGSITCDSSVELLCMALISGFSAVVFSIRAYKLYGNSQTAAIIVGSMFTVFLLRFLYLSIRAKLIKNALISVRDIIFNKDLKIGGSGG